MKVKDLDPKTNMGGVKVKTSEGKIGYWRSQWGKGVWLSQEPSSGRIHPQFVNDLRECMEWEITDEASNLE